MLTQEHSHMVMDSITTEISRISEEFRSLAIQKQELAYVESLKPSITKDGDQWCVLFGENLQEGIAGFGDTPMNAIFDFNKALYKSAKYTP